ncbi:MAG: hypothetical protein RL117_994 [Verrucomicrobiota bacterium]
MQQPSLKLGAHKIFETCQGDAERIIQIRKSADGQGFRFAGTKKALG